MPRLITGCVAAILLAACSTPAPAYVSPTTNVPAPPQDDSEKRAVEACIGDTGRLASLTKAYYQCSMDEAARMEPSGAQASDIVIAARASCSAQRNEMNMIAAICDGLYRDVFGTGFASWDASASKAAAELATKAVIERRVASAPRP
jgi:hypothetical protein